MKYTILTVVGMIFSFLFLSQATKQLPLGTSYAIWTGIGALGAVIPILFTIFGYIFIYDKLGGVLFSEMFKMTPPHPFVLQLSLILLGIGMVVGLIGSFMSVTKYLRWKR